MPLSKIYDLIKVKHKANGKKKSKNVTYHKKLLQ